MSQNFSLDLEKFCIKRLEGTDIFSEGLLPSQLGLSFVFTVIWAIYSFFQVRCTWEKPFLSFSQVRRTWEKLYVAFPSYAHNLDRDF